MPKIAEQARAARREQIIAAGLACFARSGYHATTMADVAAQAGVSKGTPYLYFESKEALFLALHEEWDCGAGQRVDAAVAALPEAARRRRGRSCAPSPAAIAAHVTAETADLPGADGGPGAGRARAGHRRRRPGRRRPDAPAAGRALRGGRQRPGNGPQAPTRRWRRGCSPPGCTG